MESLNVEGPLYCPVRQTLHPSHLSPNNPTSGIKRIAEILKDSQADPFDKKTIKIVRRCWRVATELPKGHEILKACRECQKLPETEESKVQTNYFTFKLLDGTLHLPAYFKDALAADSPFFKALFTNGMLESCSNEIAIGETASDFEKLIRAWLARNKNWRDIYTNSKKSQKVLYLLMSSVRFGLSVKKAEYFFTHRQIHRPKEKGIFDPCTLRCWYKERHWKSKENFEAMCEIASQLSVLCSKKVKKSLCELFLSVYRRSNNEVQKKCEDILKLLDLSVLSRNVKVYFSVFQSIQNLSNKGWAVHSSGLSEQEKQLLASPRLYSLYLKDIVEKAPITDDDLKKIAQNPNIKSLILEDSLHVTDESIIALAQFSSITKLKLINCCKLTDKSLFALAKNLKIRHLVFTMNINVTDVGVIAITQNSQIKTLDLHGCQNLGDESLFALAKNQTITKLNMGYCLRITHLGVAALALNSCLTQLRLSCIRWDEFIDEGIRALAEHSKLRILTLYFCPDMTDASIIKLAKNPYIIRLDITDNPQLTDKSAFALAKYSNINSLYVRGCKFTNEGIRAIEQHLNITVEI